MRAFLDELERHGELVRVHAEVDPKHEIGAICKVLSERVNSPAVLFEHVKGSTMPVVTQLLASNRRLALALGVTEAELFDEMVKRASCPIPPERVSRAPCQEIVLEGDDVDLLKFPHCTNNPNDGGPYVTAGHIFLKDPEYGGNLAVYRMMLRSKNELYLRLTPGHDGFDFFKNAEQRGEQELEVAVAIGVEPTVHLGSQFEPRLGVYELDIAGGLRCRPVEMVRCRTVDLEVPAEAEIVIEGKMSIPPETGPEGPFGEFIGYTTQVVPNERVLKVTTVTHRRDPIYHNIWLGKPPHEQLFVNGFVLGVSAYLDLKPVYPAIKRMYSPPWGLSLVLVVQLEERLKRPGLADNILAASMATRSGMWKYVIVVDEDINIYDTNEVLWALTSRTQPARDMLVMPRGVTTRLEPSATADGVTSKLLIDATAKADFRGTVAGPTPEMRALVEERWREYGFA
jgi:UbiD family decarboxylase